MLASTRFWQFKNLHNTELLQAVECQQVFPRHTHSHYAFGVIEHGVLGFDYRGEYIKAHQGQINLCLPDEPHTGHPLLEQGWSYRMFYLDPVYVEEIMQDASQGQQQLPFFASGVIEDSALARVIRDAHQVLTQGSPKLEAETMLQNTLLFLVQRHADRLFKTTKIGTEPRAIGLMRDYLEARFAEDISLVDLSVLTGLSRFHLVRVFNKHMGIAPHAYLRQVRVQQAKKLLLAGQGIAAVALETGFTDQSHLNRWCKRLWGVTPAQISAIASKTRQAN